MAEFRRPRKVFDKLNPNWDNIAKKNNAIFVSLVSLRLDNLLKSRGYVTLNEAYFLLGFERTIDGGRFGWIRDADPSVGDGRIDFGIWSEGVTHGMDIIHGRVDFFTLRFNVDRTTEPMPKRIRRLREEG